MAEPPVAQEAPPPFHAAPVVEAVVARGCAPFRAPVNAPEKPPTEVGGRRLPVAVRGVRYESVTEALEALGLSWADIRKARREGLEPAEAIEQALTRREGVGESRQRPKRAPSSAPAKRTTSTPAAPPAKQARVFELPRMEALPGLDVASTRLLHKLVQLHDEGLMPARPMWIVQQSGMARLTGLAKLGLLEREGWVAREPAPDSGIVLGLARRPGASGGREVETVVKTIEIDGEFVTAPVQVIKPPPQEDPSGVPARPTRGGW